MEAPTDNYCVRPFNHLPFLSTAIIGGGAAFLLAIAFTKSSSYGLFILFGLFVAIYALLFYGYVWHIQSYRKHYKSYTYKPGSGELQWAMVIQAFILLCWLLFSGTFVYANTDIKGWWQNLEKTRPVLVQKPAA